MGGAARSPSVYEIELGAPLNHALRLAGGTSEPLQAVLLGGLAGTWLPLPAMRARPLADHACRRAGTRLGIAALIALSLKACGLAGSALRAFERDLDSHLHGHPCPAASRTISLPIPTTDSAQARRENHHVPHAT